MITTTSTIQWSLLFDGELMLSPSFSSYEDCVDYIKRSPSSADSFKIVSRIVVTQQTEWTVWE